MPDKPMPSTADEGWTVRKMPKADADLAISTAKAVASLLDSLDIISDSNDHLSALSHCCTVAVTTLAIAIQARGEAIGHPVDSGIALKLALHDIRQRLDRGITIIEGREA